MSFVNLCKLCMKSCTEFEYIYDDSGHHTEIYDITVQYFHPMFLNTDQGNQQPPVVCLNCWCHIYNFNIFQKSVVQIQVSLLQIESAVSLEETQATTTDDGDEDLQLPQEELMEPSCIRTEIFDNEKSNDECMKDQHKNEDEEDEDDGEEIDTSLTESFGIHFSSDEDTSLPRSVAQTNDLSSQYSPSTSNVGVLNMSSARQIPSSDVEKSKPRQTPLEQLDNFLNQCQPSLTCNGCGFSCATSSKLTNHFPRKKPNGCCYILCCQQKLELLDDIKNHLHLHIDPNTFQCELCGKNHVNRVQLYSHMYHQHPTLMGNYFRTKASVSKYFDEYVARWQSVLKCPECNESCSSFSLLSEHFNLQHPHQTCYISCCQRNFSCRHEIKQHIRLHMSTTFQCTFCGKMYTEKNFLINHTFFKHANAILSEHMPTMQEYPCPICGKLYKNLVDFRKHIIGHREPDQYQCSHCIKSFKYRSGLNRHVRKEHPQ